MKKIEQIIIEIETFKSIDGDWLRLDELVIELWESKKPELGINTLFKVFEKYPNEDGSGVFWTILHGLETLNYEESLYNSLIKKPSLMGLLMLKRIENSKCELIASKSISDLKNNIKNNPDIESELLEYL